MEFSFYLKQTILFCEIIPFFNQDKVKKFVFFILLWFFFLTLASSINVAATAEKKKKSCFGAIVWNWKKKKKLM